MDAWLGSVHIQYRPVKSRAITKVTLDRCCLWERLVLVHMFSIKRGWSCNADMMWDDRTHAVVKDSIALSEEGRVNGLQTGDFKLKNQDSECLIVYCVASVWCFKLCPSYVYLSYLLFLLIGNVGWQILYCICLCASVCVGNYVSLC